MSYAKQSEILFLWDGENWNPNGDMLNSNAPRYDEISRKALVSDVRIKRTIRDYLDNRGHEIFVKEEASGTGLADGKQRVRTVAGDATDKVETIIQKCIDVRAFGGVFPVEKETNSLTGSIQFKMSKSLHQTEITFIKGTGAFASTAGKENKTFREEYVLPYAVFATYGIVNALNSSKSKLTDADVDTVADALWFGTKNLISRSKFGQLPRFLLKITYKEAGHFIGGLDNMVTLSSDKASESELTSIRDYTVNLDKIIQATSKHADKIESIEYTTDGNITIKEIPANWKQIDTGI
jgi:CRISPR-associated protein Csh2